MARARTNGEVAFPTYGPWGSWYPWFTSGFGWDLGFVTYNPWQYGATRWAYGPYGLWYDPYAYDPFWYSGAGFYGGSGYAGEDQAIVSRHPTGSIRLRVDPDNARVYIDGALAGTVDEFDGLVHHLDVDAGTHQLELRADGYKPYTTTISVSADRTMTERVNLEKQ